MDRGDFEIVLPPDELRPFVRRYLYANRPLRSPLTLRGKPTGYAYFCNFFEEPDGTHCVIDGRLLEPKHLFLVGQTLEHDIRYHHAGALKLIICELAATAPRRLFGIPGDRVFGMACAFEEAAPQYAALARGCLVQSRGAARDRHVAEANAFFSRLQEHASPPDPQVERAVALIEAANGGVRIAEVCDRIGVGERQLNRKFHRYVGLSPKSFARVLQINWVVGLLYADDAAKLTAIAQEAGFYDQAHFNRAMQRFFKEGPREFLRSNHPAFRSFLAGSRRYGPGATDKIL
jgi:AraC-like DNA-binding protein